ncbi:MAG: Peptidase protein, partial [Candidatus Poribacteria bacterium]|nr:Peptidase protein [Candidatus Poribacteria bacterium]
CLTSSAIELDTSKFMTVDQIKPGMKGIGKTVFSGTKIEEFQIEVIDIAKNVVNLKSDIIWVMCSGGPLEETGVISGMSGSPVYIDGKLIGAIAYRVGEFPKRPIAGVTPIADMLAITENSEKGGTTGQKMMDESDIPFPFKNKLDYEEKQSEMKLEESSSSATILEPIQIPVTMSGFNPKTIEYISPILKKYGMTPVQGGGTSTQNEPADLKVEPGSVIVIQFVKGDADISGSGTITYVDGNKVLAFGHPMYGMGKTNIPVSVGRISLLFPSMLASSKYGSPVRTIGTLIQDDQHGVLTDLNKQPEFIPMKVRVKSLENNQVKEYNFEIAKSRIFSPTFILSTALDSILSATKTMGDYTMKTHSEITMKGYPKFVRDDVFSGTAPDVVANDFALPVYLIMQNRFEEVDIENISLDINFEDKRTNAMIDDVRINKSLVKPGDSVSVTMSITPYMQDSIVKQFDVTIPKDIPEGRMLLRISDATSNTTWERSRAPMKSRYTDIPQLIKLIQEDESNNNIIVELFSPKAGAIVRGEELPALPLTALNVINSSKQVGNTGPTFGTTFLKQRISTDYVISGNVTLPLTIDRDAP